MAADAPPRRRCSTVAFHRTAMAPAPGPRASGLGRALRVAHPEALPSVLAAGATALGLGVALALLLAIRDRRVETLRAEVERLRVETAALGSRTLPRVVEHLRQGDSAETALHRVTLPEDPGTSEALRLAAGEISDAERRRSAEMAACATAAGRVQALTTTMLADLRAMQERHGDAEGGDEILGDLMHLDHTTAQAGRMADGIAVLTGARSGRRWSRSIPMESILRGAMGRIGAYRRVRTHSVSRLAVAGFAAEGVIHALAELLDNAAKFSRPPPRSTSTWRRSRRGWTSWSRTAAWSWATRPCAAGRFQS